MSTAKAPAAPSGRICEKSNFRCRENIFICRPLRRLRRLAVEYVYKDNPKMARDTKSFVKKNTYNLRHCMCQI